jgi:chromosome segregation protein
MTMPARLLSVRLHGFKSFAERTQVAFGPGISAVVGPNGSGKSNLADALRWALGEQGRALRTRRAEDVIWAGSERRPAVGMADVQLVLDNADGLLPVEFGAVELGRRLYRSGESEYVLNRQRVRLRDLVDLLDAAHLAQNAFLFIGQGMVDQALALRPEERRPLFEEAAGVRRHERRRRHAEEQLAESDANLARIDDLLAELRPQARRLAAQAQQQASRRDAGDELAAALLVAAHARWHAAASRVARAELELGEQRRAVEAALAELAAREAAATGFADRLAERAAATAAARRELDEARERLTAERLAGGAMDGEAAALERDRSRLEAERQATEADLQAARRSAGAAGPLIDAAIETDLRAAEAAVAEASAELAQAGSAGPSADAELAAARRAAAARTAELDVARRRHLELERAAAEETERAGRAAEARAAAAAAQAAAAAELDRARADEARASQVADRAGADAEAAGVVAASAAARSAALESRAAEARGRLDALRTRLASEEQTPLGAAARAAGGARLAEGLVVEPSLAAAVAAVLGRHGGAYVVGRSEVSGLAGLAGTVVVAEALSGPRPDAATERFLATIRAAGGALLSDAVREDPTGAARRLLARAVWLPDVAACLRFQPSLPAGWVAVSRDGRAVVGEAVVELQPADGALADHAAVERLAAELRVIEAEAVAAADERRRAAAEAEAAKAAALASASAAGAAADRRRTAEAAEAAAGRRAEAALREAAWLEGQAERLRAAVGRAAEAVAALEAAAAEVAAAPRGRSGAGLEALQRRVAELRDRRDRLEATWRAAEAGRREAERERSRAEAAVAIGERRLAEIEAALAGLAGREADLARRRSEGARTRELAAAAEAAASARVEALLALDAEDRDRLGGAERAAAAAREALRLVEEVARAAEHEELEARLALESLREQLLVELAGLGELALRHLGATVEAAPPTPAPDGGRIEASAQPDAGETAADVARLEAALAAAAGRWTIEPPPAEAPSPGRLAALRRRFHELGAANPFALEEHAALAARLAGLESQRDDLVAAVTRTRELIAELDRLIASQFQTTFSALERAFDARFRQLFGGGFARLTLTEPGDPAASGIDITARPPGKKAQALAMLSGGERALTAVALLFAMLEVRPVPFCVLDEVDAALDEANIGRFTDALRELAARTQFVVITHNRGTIETADALYGVTVGDDSVSRVISLRLDEATALADAAATGRRRAPIVPAGLAPGHGGPTAAAEVPERGLAGVGIDEPAGAADAG